MPRHNDNSSERMEEEWALLSPWSLRFRDAALEREFAAERSSYHSGSSDLLAGAFSVAAAAAFVGKVARQAGGDEAAAPPLAAFQRAAIVGLLVRALPLAARLALGRPAYGRHRTALIGAVRLLRHVPLLLLLPLRNEPCNVLRVLCMESFVTGAVGFPAFYMLPFFWHSIAALLSAAVTLGVLVARPSGLCWAIVGGDAAAAATTTVVACASAGGAAALQPGACRCPELCGMIGPALRFIDKATLVLGLYGTAAISSGDDAGAAAALGACPLSAVETMGTATGAGTYATQAAAAAAAAAQAALGGRAWHGGCVIVLGLMALVLHLGFAATLYVGELGTRRQFLLQRGVNANRLPALSAAPSQMVHLIAPALPMMAWLAHVLMAVFPEVLHLL